MWRTGDVQERVTHKMTYSLYRYVMSPYSCVMIGRELYRCVRTRRGSFELK